MSDEMSDPGTRKAVIFFVLAVVISVLVVLAAWLATRASAGGLPMEVTSKPQQDVTGGGISSQPTGPTSGGPVTPTNKFFFWSRHRAPTELDRVSEVTPEVARSSRAGGPKR
jgi:hypothetical protein